MPAAILRSLVALTLVATLPAEVCNLRLVTDASPDYNDLSGLIHSVTSKWEAPQDKCWAMFYWNHIARRQTHPMYLHGTALTDPIRQFNDYGYTMCSTITGINQSLWEAMGLKHKYYDVSLHTVGEVEYDGRYHMYDNAFSAMYTMCDGTTIAGVEDLGKDGQCAASGGKSEPSHIVKYHCLNATSPNGFLEGCDSNRGLAEDRHFLPKYLKYRDYYYDWDNGHRYILNLKQGEVYTRSYRKLGDAAKFFVPNEGKDPDSKSPRYRIRGNGLWRFTPALTPDGFLAVAHSSTNISVIAPAGLQPTAAATPAEAIFKVQSANVTTGQTITASFRRASAEDQATIAVSTDNGLHWIEVWRADVAATGELATSVELVEQVNGAYDTLIKVTLLAKATPSDVALASLEIETTTMLNSKTQPKLSLGKNTVYLGAGEQTESIVFWPELMNDGYKRHIAEEKNVASAADPKGYLGVMYPTVKGEDAWVVYRLDAPNDITRVTYGGRFYNRAPKAHIDLSYSLDGGTTWTPSWSLTDTKSPWDKIHYESVEIPKGNRSVWLKYLMTGNPSPSGCSIYAVRMEADYVPPDPAFKPIEVTFTWAELQKDRSQVRRSHTQLVDTLPATYVIDVGGVDHPIVESLAMNLAGSRAEDVTYGYSDGVDVGGEKFVPVWATYGKNLAIGKPYTVSEPSETKWKGGDPDGKKLTDGIVGPPYAGGTSYASGALYGKTIEPLITVDLGAPTACASFGLNIHGYPSQDALKGQVTDRIEVYTSDDGKEFTPRGLLQTDIFWKDLPVNYMWPDDETMTCPTCRLVPPAPVTTRFVRFKLHPQRMMCCTEIEVLDAIMREPFDLRIALPNELP
jgi:hypothetical protein